MVQIRKSKVKRLFDIFTKLLLVLLLIYLPVASAVTYVNVYPMNYTQEHNDSETSTSVEWGYDVQVSNITSMYQNISGNIYFKIDMRTTVEGDAARIRVYKNGVGSSLCLLQTVSTTYETKQCTLPSGTYNQTDYILIKGASFSSGVTSWFKNASLNYNYVIIISIVNNTKTNDTAISKIFLNNSESITFYADADQPITSWNWYIDHVLQSNNSDNLTTSWSTGKYHYVMLNATNINEVSNTLTWDVNVYPAMATATIGALNETPANEIRNALENKDAPALVMATALPFTNLIGAFFYAIVWFIVFLMMWIKQKSMNIPMVIGIIFGGLIISFLPEQYQLVATALIVMGIFAIIYIFFKGRG